MATRTVARRTPLLMMRTRGLVGPAIHQGKKSASPTSRKGVKSNGNYILYKQNNP